MSQTPQRCLCETFARRLRLRVNSYTTPYQSRLVFAARSGVKTSGTLSPRKLVNISAARRWSCFCQHLEVPESGDIL